jgi:hypothetical protein
MLMIAEEGVKTIMAGVCELVTSLGSRPGASYVVLPPQVRQRTSG